MTDRSVNSPDSFYAAVKASQPGDSVTIAGGAYPAFGVPPVSIAEPGVSVRPAAGATVILEGLDVSGSAGLKVSGVEIAVKVWGWKPALYCANASRNTFDDMVIHSAGDPADLSKSGGGFQFRNAQDCALTNSELHHLGIGGATLQCDRILIQANRFHDIAVDGIDIGTSNYTKIYGNDFRRFFPPVGAHPDAIQFWDTLNLGATGNEARDNTIDGLESTPMGPQGVFVENQQNLTVTGNAMTGTISNGISLSAVDGALVEGNFVQNAGMICRGGSTKTVWKDNLGVLAPGTYAGPGEAVVLPADFLVSGTVIIPTSTPPDTTAYDAWVAKAKASGGTIPGATATPTPPVVTPAPPPPPVVTPTGPTQADLDAANAMISQLQAKAAALQNTATAAQAALTDAQAKATKYATGLNTVIVRATANVAKRGGPTKADDRALIDIAKTALA